MTRTTRPAAGKTGGHRKEHAAATLDALIEDATVDAYDESEQRAGFYTMLEDHLAIPFTTRVLGMEATVERIDLTDDEEIVAVCARGRSRQRIRIVDLPLPDPPPKGSAWIEAYHRWARRR
jgi:hypothetical protein